MCQKGGDRKKTACCRQSTVGKRKQGDTRGGTKEENVGMMALHGFRNTLVHFNMERKGGQTQGRKGSKMQGEKKDIGWSQKGTGGLASSARRGKGARSNAKTKKREKIKNDYADWLRGGTVARWLPEVNFVARNGKRGILSLVSEPGGNRLWNRRTRTTKVISLRETHKKRGSKAVTWKREKVRKGR